MQAAPAHLLTARLAPQATAMAPQGQIFDDPDCPQALAAHSGPVAKLVTGENTPLAVRLANIQNDIQTLRRPTPVVGSPEMRTAFIKAMLLGRVGEGFFGGLCGVVFGGVLGLHAGGVAGGVFGAVVSGLYGGIGGLLFSGVGTVVVAGGTALSVSYAIAGQNPALGVAGTLVSLLTCMGIAVLPRVVPGLLEQRRQHAAQLGQYEKRLAALAAEQDKIQRTLTADGLRELLVKNPQVYALLCTDTIVPHLRQRLANQEAIKQRFEAWLAGYEDHVAKLKTDFLDNETLRAQLLAQYIEQKAKAETGLEQCKQAIAMIQKLIEFYTDQATAAEAIFTRQQEQQAAVKQHAAILGTAEDNAAAAQACLEQLIHDMTALFEQTQRILGDMTALAQTESELNGITMGFDLAR